MILPTIMCDDCLRQAMLKKTRHKFAAMAIVFLSVPTLAIADSRPIVIGSKTFTESYLLGEIMAQTLESAGFEVERRFGFGGTLICYEALRVGEIDVYPEYTGTIRETILKDETIASDLESLNRALRAQRLQVLEPFGFSNTYAIAVTEATAAQHDLSNISDLVRAPSLEFGLSHEFRRRPDGWPGLKAHYGLPQETIGIEHGLAYQAINEGSIDVTDAYSTDGDLLRYKLTLLTDDAGFFPDYLGLPLARGDLPEAASTALAVLSGQLTETTMQSLNAKAADPDADFAAVAAGFLAELGLRAGSAERSGGWSSLGKNTVQHLKLTGIALGLAMLAGIALALAVYRSPGLSRSVLYLAGLLQTVPSIALLALLIPLAGVGQVPAIVALFLYSLLPILRNTITALTTIDPLLKRVAEGLGLNESERLRRIYLPLAMPYLLAGTRIAAVISIGTATLAAFIGAGGLGEPIVTGLALNDTRLILTGAIPAAGLAIVTELIFEAVERFLVPSHLRARPA